MTRRFVNTRSRRACERGAPRSYLLIPRGSLNLKSDETSSRASRLLPEVIPRDKMFCPNVQIPRRGIADGSQGPQSSGIK